ncbi:MAG: multidrug transporter [Clostridia bacterium]|nr:multidrug transporter [Clostridia bacterium]
MGLFKSVRWFWGSFRYRICRNKSGMGTVEIIIIIAVLVTLALIFRGFIMDLAEGIFDKIREKTDAAMLDM